MSTHFVVGDEHLFVWVYGGGLPGAPIPQGFQVIERATGAIATRISTPYVSFRLLPTEGALVVESGGPGLGKSNLVSIAAKVHRTPNPRKEPEPPGPTRRIASSTLTDASDADARAAAYAMLDAGKPLEALLALRILFDRHPESIAIEALFVAAQQEANRLREVATTEAHQRTSKLVETRIVALKTARPSVVPAPAVSFGPVKKAPAPIPRTGAPPKLRFVDDVAKHRRSEPTDHRRADRARDVIVARGDVGGQRSQRVEGRLVTDRKLPSHVLLDEVHRDVPRALDHHLDILTPGDLGELAERVELGELSLVVRVRDRPWTQPIAEAEAHVVGLHDLADLLEVRVQEVLFVVGQAPLGEDRTTARNDAGHALCGERDVTEPDAGVDGEVVDALLGLLDQGVAVDLPGVLAEQRASYSAEKKAGAAELARLDFCHVLLGLNEFVYVD